MIPRSVAVFAGQVISWLPRCWAEGTIVVPPYPSLMTFGGGASFSLPLQWSMVDNKY